MSLSFSQKYQTVNLRTEVSKSIQVHPPAFLIAKTEANPAARHCVRGGHQQPNDSRDKLREGGIPASSPYSPPPYICADKSLTIPLFF